jgi:hypothetical protein
MSSKLHLIEIDFIIYFPSFGNENRSVYKYGVVYRDRKNNKTQPGVRINLEDVLALPNIKNGFPHTIGFFTDASGKGKTFLPIYKDKRKISSETELIQWIKVLGL